MSSHAKEIVRCLSLSVLIYVFIYSAGCSADIPANPSFALTFADAKVVLEQMRQDPKPLKRPLIIVSGYHDPGIIAPGIAKRFRAVTSETDKIITVTFFSFSLGTFDACRDWLIGVVQQNFPNDSPSETTEVDVIGFSMGGLVARHAAMPREDEMRLRINNLFTISTPHKGASLAWIPTLDSRQVDMRKGSAFLMFLDKHLTDSDYELFTYCRLDDLIVGAKNTAPQGLNPWWVPNPPFSLAHTSASTDPRILADIARRVRGEHPFATLPAASLPQNELQETKKP